MAGVGIDTCTANEWFQCVCCGEAEAAQKFLACLHPCCEQCLRVKSADSDTLTCSNCSTVTVLSGTLLQDNFLVVTQQDDEDTVVEEAEDDDDDDDIILSQLYQEKCKILDKKIFTLNTQIKELEENVLEFTRRIEQNEEAKDGLKNEVKSRAAALKETIDNACQSYCNQIDEFYEHTNLALTKQNLEIKEIVTKLETTVRFEEVFRSMCSKESAVRYHSFVDKELKRIYSEAKAKAELKELPKDTITLKAPYRKVASFRTEDFLGRLSMPDTFACAVEQADVKVSTVWSTAIGDSMCITGLDFNSSGDILLVGYSDLPYPYDDDYMYVYGAEGEEKCKVEIPVKNPDDMSMTAEDIYVSNRSESFVVMDARGQVKCTYKIPGVRSVAAAKDGKFYATTDDDRLFKCTVGGADAEELVLARGHLDCPCCLCLTPQGHIAVSNAKSNRVCVFDQQGRLQFHYQGQGQCERQLSDPCGVCCDGAGHIYIADTDNNRVSVITSNGEFLTNVVTEEHGVKWPWCVGLNAQGTRLAVGHSENELTVFKIQL